MLNGERLTDMETWHSLEVDEVLQKLNTQREGLSSEEAKTRLQRYGYNVLVEAKKRPLLKILLRQFKSILILILLIATAISFVIGEALDASIILAIVVASIALGFAQEYRAEKALEALKKMLSPTATVLRDREEQVIAAREIVPGDILVLKEGDKVPADGRLIEAVNLQVNEASLTGESMPVTKETRKISEDVPLPDRKNMVFSGTEITYGKGKAVVVATGMNTEFGKIAKEVVSVAEEQTPLERRIGELGKWLGFASLAVCIAVIGFGVLRELFMAGFVDTEFVFDMVLFGIALAVASVPEALPAVVTGSLAIGMYKMAKRNALVRKMPAVETLGCVTVICSDKTGTLTKGEMTVRKIYIGGKVVSVTGVGYEPKGEFHV